jgi:alpha-L-fucosidase 2
MLLQSHNGIIQLLPALPSEWPDGNIYGLRARGVFEVDMEWENTKLVYAAIHSINGGICKVKYQGIEKEISTQKGETYYFNNELKVQNEPFEN